MTKPWTRHWFLPVSAWIAVIFLSSTSFAGNLGARLFQLLSVKLWGHAPRHWLGLLSFLAEKGVHVVMFLVLGSLLWEAIKAIADVRMKIAVIMASGLLIGSASEFLQRFFPGRDPAVRDVLINLAGTAIGAALGLALARSRRDQSLSVEDQA